MQLPFPLRRAIEEELTQARPDILAEAASALSRQYRAGHRSGKRPKLSQTQALAYLATRLPATYAAACSVLAELRMRMPEVSFKSLLDLGAGQGAAMWAAGGVFDELETVSLVEADQNLIDSGKRLAEKSTDPALQAAQWMQGNLEREVAAPPHDLVLISYALGELQPQAQLRLIQRAWRLARKALVVIEPGTMTGYANVMQARTELIGQGARLVAPCPHALPCPMEESDWCHFSARVERATFHKRAKMASSAYEDEKFAYVIGTRLEAQVTVEARIVRHPKIFKGHINLELCTMDGLKHLTITRTRKNAFRKARKADWGDTWQTNEE